MLFRATATNSVGQIFKFIVPSRLWLTVGDDAKVALAARIRDVRNHPNGPWRVSEIVKA